MDANGVKIIRGYDASDGALGAIAEAERGAHDFGHDEGVDEGAAFLQVEDVGPGDIGRASFTASSSRDCEESFLVNHKGVGAEENSFDPTEDGGIGANSKSEAEDGEDGKAGAAAENAEADAEVLPQAVKAQRKPNTARVFAGKRGCAHATVGGVTVAGFLLEHLAVEVHFLGEFGGLSALAEKVEDAAN